MQNQLKRYVQIARRWGWIVLIGMVICSTSTYLISKRMHPVYEASATLVISVGNPASGGTESSIAAVPTYAQLLTNPLVLNPVVAKHPGMTLQQLNAMMVVKPQTSTQIIYLDVDNGDPQLAKQLANEISQSFQQYANGQLPGAVTIWPAQEPTNPIKPQSLQDGIIGALVGLGLAIALIFLFEWIEDRPTSSEAIQQLLGMEIVTSIPDLSGKERGKKSKKIPIQAEKYRMLCANLITTQAVRTFKMIMITSALAGEGKSTVAANLATYLAKAGKRVLLVDGNLRHPSLHQHFQLSNHRGLSNVFIENWSSPSIELFGQGTDIFTLRVLTSGISLPDPAEMLQSSLASRLFEYYRNTPFDYIIFDTPPLLPIADSQILATLVEAVLLVVDASKTPRRALLRAKRLLNKTSVVKLGAVINKSPWSDYGDDLRYPDKVSQSQIDYAMLQPLNTPILSSTIDTIIIPSAGKKIGRSSSLHRTVLQNNADQTYRQ